MHGKSTTVTDDDHLPGMIPGLRQCPYLLVLHGEDRGLRVPLVDERVTLGRTDEADVVIHDERISHVHCALLIRNNRVSVEDLGSRNGIHVDGRRVSQARLGPYSQLRIGHTLIRIEVRTDAEMQLEKALVQSERMAAVGVLAKGVAHTFNNINTATLGYCELALRDPDLPEHIRPFLKSIEQSIGRARLLTGNLMAFAGRSDTLGERTRKSLDEVVRATADLLVEQYESDGIDLRIETAHTPPTMLDSAAVGQALLHLIVNATHALEGREERRIEIRTGASEDAVWVRVDDTGCGIPSEELEHVFTPFYSRKGEHAAPNSSLVLFRGQGLGLSIAHTIARLHGGSLRAESTVGEGSSFTLSLPFVLGDA